MSRGLLIAGLIAWWVAGAIFFYGPQNFESGTTLASAGLASLGGTPTIETADPRGGTNHFRIDGTGLEWANHSGDLTISGTQLCIDAYLKRTADRAAPNVFLGLGRTTVNYAPYVCSGASSGTLKMACGVGCTTAASSDLSGFSGAAYQRMQIEWDSSPGTGKLGLDHGTPVTCDGADSQTMFPRWAWGKNTSGFQYELDDYAIYEGACWHPPRRDESVTASEGSPTTFSFTRSGACDNGDLCLAFIANGRDGQICASTSGGTCSNPDGWTELQDINGASIALAIYQKTGGGSEPATYYWTGSGIAKWSGGITDLDAYFKTSGIVSGCSTPAFGTSATCPSLTALKGSKVYRYAMADNDAVDLTSSSPEIWQQASPNGTHENVSALYEEQMTGTGTSTGTLVVSAGSSENMVCCTVAVPPASTDPNP